MSNKNKKLLKKLTMMSAAAMTFASTGVSAFAASSTVTTNNEATKNDLKNSDIFETSNKGSITIHKYDITAATAAGDYKEGTNKPTGETDTDLEKIMKDYTIKGVEFTYLRLGNVETHSVKTTASNNEANRSTKEDENFIELVYEVPEKLAAILGLADTKGNVLTISKDAVAKNGTTTNSDLVAIDMSSKDATVTTQTGFTSSDTTGTASSSNPTTSSASKATESQPCTNEGILHYTSEQLNKALKNILANGVAYDTTTETSSDTHFVDRGTENTDDRTSDSKSAKDALEEYIKAANGAVKMAETDANGVTSATDLDLGLYLIVETKVPEEVTTTVNPWFVQLPFTNSDEGTETGNTDKAGDSNHKDSDSTDSAETGRRQWIYDMVCYPKDQTGNPTLDKMVRNATGKDNSTKKAAEGYDYLVYNKDDVSTTNNKKTDTDANYVADRDEYTYDETVTASEGDVLDYILVSKLPHISSKATYLTEYSFTDILSEGIEYQKDVQVAFYLKEADAKVNDVTKAVEIWTYDNGVETNNNATSESELTDHTTGTSMDSIAGLYSTVSTDEDKANKNYVAKYANVKTGRDENGKTSVVVNFTSAGLEKINTVYSDYYMVVYYTAQVNSDATAVLGDEGNPNDVTLTWRRTNQSYFNTLEDRSYVYTFGIDLSKYFSDNAGDYSKVKFVLYNATDGYYVTAEKTTDPKTTSTNTIGSNTAVGTSGAAATTTVSGQRTYYVTGKTTDESKATKFVPDADGRFIINGLEGDVYQLTETDTADGYSLLKDPITIQINTTDREIIPAVAGTIGLQYNTSDQDEITDAANIIDNYNKSQRNTENNDIIDKTGTQVDTVTETKIGDEKLTAAVNQAYVTIANETANGRTIGKSSMYEGDILSATALVDGVQAVMNNYTANSSALRTGQVDSANAIVNLGVTNSKGFNLPKTGSGGIYAMTIGGVIAVAIGGYVVSRKKEEKVTPNK